MKYLKKFRLFESSEEDGIFDVAKTGFGLITPNGKIIGCSMYDHINILSKDKKYKEITKEIKQLKLTILLVFLCISWHIIFHLLFLGFSAYSLLYWLC